MDSHKRSSPLLQVLKLFVDSDDTLVLWNDSEAIQNGYELNGALFEYIFNWREVNPDGVVILWSGGGDVYADTWHNRLDPDGEIFDFCLGKFRMIPDGCDIFVDDMPDWLWHGYTINPRDL